MSPEIDLMNRTALVLSLSALGNVGPVRVKGLLASAPDPLDILSWDEKRLSEIPGIGPEQARRIRTELNLDYGLKVIEWAETRRFAIVTILDQQYPSGLRELYDPPPFLFISGSITTGDDKAIAIVGSRHASEYGRNMAVKFADELCRRGVTIVSGMAAGVDSSAHRGALNAAGRTLAVLGSGIDVIYPPENKNLYAEISEHGAVISEFFPGAAPNPGHFPRRNRIISGLSLAVIVVEAGEKSGALLTADNALSQEKPLFAVPGNLSSRTSTGTHALIKAGAHLLTSIDDIFSVLPHLKNDYIAPHKKPPVDLTEGERRVLERMSSTPMQIDTLVRECGISAAEAASYVLSLELRGLVKQLSGKRFVAVT